MAVVNYILSVSADLQSVSADLQFVLTHSRKKTVSVGADLQSVLTYSQNKKQQPIKIAV